MKCKLIRDMPCKPDDDFPNGIKPAGTIIDHPDVWKLVRFGVAEPADDECRDAAAMTPERFAAARHAYERVSRGIHPDDYAAYERGEMVGYNPDGSWIPGPHYDDGGKHDEQVRES